MRDEKKIINEFEQSKVETIPNNSAPSLQIMIVDCHEPEGIIETLRQEKGIYIKVQELESGDYVFSNISVERKTVKDFYNSIVHGDKRIWQQMFNLKRCFERPMLVIERWDDSFLVESHKQRAVLSAMARIAMMGITVIVLPGKEKDWKFFTDFLSYLFFASDKKEPSLKPVPKKSHQETITDVREDMVTMIPMFGRKKAKEILSRYPTIKDLCNADEEDLKKRVGPKTAQMLIDVLKKEQ